METNAQGLTGAPSAPTGGDVVVAMLTYRRPELLAAVVPVLLEQARPLGAAVVLVDNDPDGGAADAAGRWVAEGLTYLHEPRPGIAAGRNRALDHALAAGAAAVVFLDDDEVPRPGWLQALVGAWRGWGCAAVVGPAVPTFDVAPDAWVAASGLFDRTVHPSGTRVRGAATNNLLLDLAVLRAEDLRFDDAFGLTGGSDSMLTRALTRRGHEIRWCDEAEVDSPVPARRSTRQYVVHRSFRTGTTWSRVSLALESGPRRHLRRAELVARGVLRCLKGSLVVVRGALTGSLRSRATGAVHCAAGAGMLSGALGVAYVEYARRGRSLSGR